MDPTEPLVDDAADARARRALTAALASQKPSTPAQRGLRGLVEKIELAREELKSWLLYAPHHQQRVTAELGPLWARVREGQRKMVLAIDEILSEPQVRGHALRRVHRALLRELLVGLVKVLRTGGRPDEELDAVLAKHAQEQAAEELALARRFVRGVKGDHGAASAGPLYSKGATQLEEEHARSAAASGLRCRSPSRAQAAREEARKESEETLREAHRTLLSRRHPERPEAQARKDPMLKRVNAAYKSRDLLTLLGQQLELGQLDVQQLCSAPRLQRYKTALRQQYSGLQDQLKKVWEFYAPLVGRDLAELTVQGVDRQLTREIQALNRTLQGLASDLVQLKDPKGRRALLDRLGHQQEQRMQTAILITVDAMATLQSQAEGPKRKKKR